MTIGPITLPQEDATRVYSVGHRVIYKDGHLATIANIRVWHDGFFSHPVFDLNFEGGSSRMNVRIGDFRALG